MKKCPNCQQVYHDDNQFCLNDGTTLSYISEAGQSPPPFQTPDSVPTQFFSLPQTSVAKPPADSSKWLYLIIGVMATALVALGITFFMSRNSAEKETAKTDSTVRSNENTTNANLANAENKTSEPPVNKSDTTAFAPPPRPVSSINPNLTPTGRWSGDWNSKTTYFTAELNLTDNGAGKVSGQIYWTLRRTTNPKKIDKTGSTATEYVQGTFNPATRMVSLNGFRKDDPNNIVVLDKYNLVLAENNQTLGGGSKSNGLFNLRH